jgi:hypothetical protein
VTARRFSWHQQLFRRPARRTARQVTVLAAVVAVMASYGVVGGTAASAASLSGSTFEIDDNANLVVDGGSGSTDWLTGGSGTAMRSGVLVRDDRPTGQDDDAFTQGTNINDTPTTITTGSIPNNKSDLTHFGIYVDKQASDAFVNVFWTRVQAPSGTTTMDFEFNQSAVRQNDISPPNNPDVDTHTIPLRTAGDILITYFLENGGTHPMLTKRTWTGSVWGPATTFSASDALGSINTSAITAAAAGGLGALDPLTFGEASIKLSAFVPPSDACTTFGSVYLRSRSSATDTDENKDFIAPEPVTITNCGSVQIHKTDKHGALAGAGFTLYKDVAPLGGGSAGVEDKVAGNVIGTCTTDANGDCTITDVPKASYWLVETTVPAGHDAVADQYVTITTADQVVSLNLVDPIPTGTLVVTKVAVPQDPQDFTFTQDGNAFTLDDDPASATPNSQSFTVDVGSHTVVETSIPTGWVNTALSCDDPTATVSLGTSTATVDISKGETVHCTYTDTWTKLNPNLTTQATAAVADTSWNDTASLTGDGTHAVTGTVAFYACDPAATATACTTGGTKVGTDAAVTHASGATYTATTTTAFAPSAAGWTCFRAEFTSTSPYYASSTHTNATTECFLKHNQNLTVSKTATPAYGRVYQWTIDKAVDQSSVTIAAGSSATSHYTVTVGHTASDGTWTVAGTITVTNPNPVAFTGVNVTDAIDNGAGSCAVTGGTNATVPASGSATFDYLCTYAQAPTTSTGVNTATATWDSTANFTTSGTASGTASVDFSAVTPTTTDEVVTVTDSVQGVLGTLDGATADNPTVFEYDVTRPGVAGTCTTYPNTASFATNDTSTTGSDSASVEVCVGSPLTVTGTAAGSYDRSYAWTLAKAGTPTLITNPNGSTGTFDYTVTVTPAGTTDSAFEIHGTVDVTNPNDWEPVVTDVTVSPDLGGSPTCTVAGGTGLTLAAGETRQLTYTCDFGGTPALSGNVTATATWDPMAASTSVGSADATTAVDLALHNEINRVVTVVDDKTDPANPVTLGTWDYLDGPHDFTYAITQTGVDNVCTDYPNVASIAETEQTATASVRLCHTFTGGGGGPVITPTPSPTPITGGGGLPFTGAALGLMARTALALLGAGLVLLLVSRKRRQA